MLQSNKTEYALNNGCIPPEHYLNHSGIELFKKIIAGELPQPPIGKTLCFEMLEAQEGRVLFKGTPNLTHYNPLGSVHGGWYGAILDSALSCAVQSKLPAGMLYTTAEYKINMIRPMFDTTGEVTCEGKAIHVGRTIGTSEARIIDKNGKLIAHGTATCAIFPVKEIVKETVKRPV